MWYGFQKTILWHFLSCLHITGRDSRPLRSCQCDLKSRPPSPCVFQVSSGYLVVVFVYVTEFIGMKARTWACIQVHSFFAVGTMVVALTGYLVRTWWIYQIILSTVTAPFVLFCWMLPETPFWLLSEGKYEEAQTVVDQMAKWNRAGTFKLSELLSLDLYSPIDQQSLYANKHRLLYLFYDCNIGKRTLIVWLIWFTACLGYYSFSLNSVNLGGNVYLNLFLIGK